MTEKDVLFVFEEMRALHKGHFKLSSGLHSEKYLQCALVLQYPEVAEKMARALLAKFEGLDVDVVIGPALGGVTWAYEVARAFKVRGLFTEREDGKMTLRRGFSIDNGERVLVVEDVVTTGGSTKEVIDVVRKLGGVVVGVGSIINRSDKAVDFGVPFQYLARVKVGTFQEQDCPMCKAGTPVTKPGSRK